MIGGAGSGMGLDRLFQGSQGMQVNRMMDALGLPDSLGDMIGAQIDASRGDWGGYARNMMDLTSGMGSGAMDKLFGKGLPGAHFLPRPHARMRRGRKLWGAKFSTPFGTHSISRERLGGRGRLGRKIGRSMERAILTNPAFKARMERVLGGRIVPDGRADGKITVQRFRPNVPGLPFSNQIANNPMLSGIFGSLARMHRNIGGVAAGLFGAAAGGIGAAGASAGVGGDLSAKGGVGPNQLQDNSMATTASQMGMKQPMSFEDMLFLVMLKYCKKKEKEIMDQMNKLVNKGKSGRSGGARRGYGGGLGGILGGVGSAIGGIYGGPMGSALGGKLGGAVGGALGGGGAGGGAGGTGGTGGANAMDPKKSDMADQAMMQRLTQQLQKVNQLLTNILKSMHEMGMASVRNIR